MCLLVTQTAQSPALTDAWLADFYSYNKDGVGVMYAVDGELVVEKILPTSEQDFINFYHSHIHGKDAAFHLRMKTHGNIDMENCHPYEVLNHSEHGVSLWLMHNGILSTGNTADTSKSDTWHYIRDYLRPMLADNPDFAFHPAFAEIIGDHIGTSNKFVLMDNLGRQAIINEDAGVYWGGLWLSNEYAWSASADTSKNFVDDLELAYAQVQEIPKRYYPVHNSGYKYGYGGYGGYGSYGDYDSEWDSYYPPVGAAQKSGFKYDVDMEMEIDDVCADMGVAMLNRAERFSRRQIMAFIDKFGYDAWQEIAYMAIDKDIDEDSYIRIMSDFAFAREMLPYLAEDEKAMKLTYIQ